jgi:hypothetical protein
MRRLPAQTLFGERVLVLAEARGLSLRELARRVPCDASHLSQVVHGRKRPSLRVAARLDDVLKAGGELAALADAAAPGSGPGPGQDPGRPAGDVPAPAVAGGMALTLPYVPARLVIEVSGPAGAAGLAAGDGVTGAAPGRLALVRGALRADGSDAG